LCRKTAGTARGDDHADRVGRQADADVVETLALVGERKAGVAVERLSIAALIVELPGDGRVPRKEAACRQRKDAGHHGRPPPLTSPARDEDERKQQERMRGLRERRHAEERRRQVIGT
jgi:hypothetical protein